MKFLSLLSILFLSQNTLAQNRIKICQYYYQHDIFTGYLNLSIEKKANNQMTLWMDTPTPYGIRPYTYEVTYAACTSEKNLHLEAQSSATTQKVIFNSMNSSKSGKMLYLNSKNEVQLELILECSPEIIEGQCN
jgi:hypothetical protein